MAGVESALLKHLLVADTFPVADFLFIAIFIANTLIVTELVVFSIEQVNRGG